MISYRDQETDAPGSETWANHHLQLDHSQSPTVNDDANGPFAMLGNTLGGVGYHMTPRFENALQDSCVQAWMTRNVAVQCYNAA
jgi:hypothetical protein